MRKRERNTIHLLGVSSMFNDIGSEMISPILPFLITSMGGGGLAVGLISGLREGLSSLLKLFGGWFSDRIGRRKEIIFFGYLASVILKLFIGVAQTATQVTMFVSLERIGKVRDPPRDAIISSLKIKKGDGFGLHQAFDSFGGMLGTVLAIFAIWIFQLNFQSIVLWGAGITALALIPLFFVKDKRVDPIKRDLIGSIRSLDKELKKIVYILSIFSLANFGLYMFIILRAEEISGSKIIPLILYAIFGLIYTICSRPCGALSDKIGRKRVLTIGYLLFFLLCLGFATQSSVYIIGILFGLYGLVFALTEPIQKAVISDLSGRQRGTAMGYFHFVRGLSVIFGGIIAGLIWGIGPMYMFLYLGIIGLIALLALHNTKKTVHKIIHSDNIVSEADKLKWEKHYK